MKSLSPRQQSFCQHYAQIGIAEQAALQAGYSKRTARAQASRLLTNVGIQRELARLAEATEDVAIADLIELRTYWTRLMRNVALPMVERIKASEILGKSLGAFVERREHSGPGGWPLGAPTVHLTLTHASEQDAFCTHEPRTIHSTRGNT